MPPSRTTKRARSPAPKGGKPRGNDEYVGATPMTAAAMGLNDLGSCDASSEGSYEAVMSSEDVMSRNATMPSGLDEIANGPQSQRRSASPTLSKAGIAEAVDIKMLLLAGSAVCLALAAAIGNGSAPGWMIILACLSFTATSLLGVGVVKQMVGDVVSGFATRSFLSNVPLTDAPLDVATVNKFANSCQVREKGLKIMQYVLRGSAYSGLFSKDLSKQLKTLSKTTSIARRFFKFFRCCKHFEDLQEAKEEKSTFLRALLYVRVAANFGADWAEDVCSLERVGLLRAGTLSVEFMLFAEFCQLVLALVEIYVTSARVRDEASKTAKVEADSSKSDKDVVKQQRKLHLMRLELAKFVSDIGKAIFDCELSFAHEGVFIVCSLFSAIVSTHKNMVKVLK